MRHVNDFYVVGLYRILKEYGQRERKNARNSLMSTGIVGFIRWQCLFGCKILIHISLTASNVRSDVLQNVLQSPKTRFAAAHKQSLRHSCNLLIKRGNAVVAQW